MSAVSCIAASLCEPPPAHLLDLGGDLVAFGFCTAGEDDSAVNLAVHGTFVGDNAANASGTDDQGGFRGTHSNP